MKYSGIVQRGKGEGRKLGYPTANIPFAGDETGVHAARVMFEGKDYHAAVFIDSHHNTLEAHLLDFDEDMYGKELCVTLVKKIRESAHFQNQSELIVAIAADIEAIRNHFQQ